MKKLLALVLTVVIMMTFAACNTADTSTNSAADTSICPANQYGIHDWEPATCRQPSKCNDCNAYRNDEFGTHYWSDATCEQPSNCRYCGTYQNDKLGNHNFLSTGSCLYCGIKYEDYITSKE